MRLYRGKIPDVAKEIVDVLTKDGDIEVLDEQKPEVQLDIEAVLNEYLRAEKEITDKARDLLAIRKLDYSFLHKIKSTLADERGFAFGDDAISYIINQLLEAFMHSVYVEEVFADDYTLRRKVGQILRRTMATETELDHEVRKRMRHLQEGTSAWEIEYEKIMGEIMRHRKLR